ncbi:DUF748 domain-containing protein [uncultured Ilyobacter sp.]|uniref:DUF748 domain-containing protein n=1 Tax=uncultured Ilyobacter sp. TaxID=544433 RepID=UPI0029BFE33F|nr:DUF748 domain-containing protein [uncultured Ilyobacter sp.]
MKPNKKIIITSVFLTLMLFFFLIKFPVYIKNTAIKKLEETLGRKINSGKFKYNHLTATIYLEDFQIMEADEKDVFLSFDSFNINVDPTKFITKTLYFKEISLINPTFRYEVSDEGKNFDDILEKMGSSKNKESKEGGMFFRKIGIGNILVDRYTLYHADKTIEGDSAVKFISPNLQYNNNILNFSSGLELSKKDSIALSLEADTSTGDFKGVFNAENITLDDTPFIINKIKGYDSLTGNIKADIPFNGNYKNKVYLLKGKLYSENFNIKNETQSISFKSGDITLNEISFPDPSINISSITLDNLVADYKKPLEDKESESNKPFEIPDFKIEELNISDSSLLTSGSSVTKIDFKGKNLTNEKESKSDIQLSFSLDEKTSVSIDSSVIFKDTLKNPKDLLQLMSSEGKLKASGGDLASLKNIKNLPYQLSTENFSIGGNYSLRYPEVSANTNISIESLGGFSEEKSSFSINHMKISNKIRYHMEDKKFKISGPGEIKSMIFKSSKGKNLFSGDFSFLSKDISKESLILDFINLKNAKIDLTSKAKETENKEVLEKEKKKIPWIYISKFDIENSELLSDDFSLTGVMGSLENLSSKKGEGKVALTGKLNNKSPMTIGGNILLDRDLEFTEDMKNIGYRGKVSLDSLGIEDLSPFLKEVPYTIEGVAKLDSDLSYTKGNFSSQNSLSVDNLAIYSNESTDEFSTKKVTSSFFIQIKDKKYNITKGKFNLEDFKGLFGKDRYSSFSGSNISLILNRLNKDEFVADELTVSKPILVIDKKTESIEKIQKSEKTKMKIDIKKLDILEGDFNLSTKNSSYPIQKILLKLNNFSTSKNKKTDISLDSVVKTGGTLSAKGSYYLREDWNFSPKTMDIDGEFTLNNLDLTPYKNILELYFPNYLNSGKTDWKAGYKIEKGKLNGTNDITFKNISLGQSTGNNTSIPLKTAVGILSDKSGNFNLKIPISGDLNNPQFKLRDIFIQSLKSILIKTVTSPLNIITKTIESEEVSKINFIFLSDDLALTEIQKLEKVSQMLKEREELSVKFILYTDFFRETELLRLKSIKDIILMSSKDSKNLESQIEDLMNSRKEKIITYFREKSQDKRISVEISTDKRVYPQADVIFISP